MNETELRKEMEAMWDSVLMGGFGVDTIDDLSPEQVAEAVRMWREEVAEHDEAEAMESLIYKVIDLS